MVGTHLGFSAISNRELAVAIAATLLIFRAPSESFDRLFLGVLVAATVWQFTWVGPYLPGAPRPVKSCEKHKSDVVAYRY